MMRRVLFATFGILALLATATPAWALTLDDVKEMVAVGVPDNIILSTIANSEETFNLSSEQIVDLTKAGVSASIIEALQGTSGQGGRSDSTTRPAEDEPRSRDRDDDRDSRSRDDDRDSRSRDREYNRESRSRDDDRDSRSSRRRRGGHRLGGRRCGRRVGQRDCRGEGGEARRV